MPEKEKHQFSTNAQRISEHDALNQLALLRLDQVVCKEHHFHFFPALKKKKIQYSCTGNLIQCTADMARNTSCQKTHSCSYHYRLIFIHTHTYIYTLNKYRDVTHYLIASKHSIRAFSKRRFHIFSSFMFSSLSHMPIYIQKH